MKYYKLKALSVGAKGNRVLFKENNETYPENTWREKRAEELVVLGFLIRIKEDPGKVKAPKEKPTPPSSQLINEDGDSVDLKPEDKKEPSLLDSMKDAGGEELEELEEPEEKSEKDKKKALYKEAKKLAKEKGIKAPHYLSGIAKIKTFINDNK